MLALKQTDPPHLGNWRKTMFLCSFLPIWTSDNVRLVNNDRTSDTVAKQSWVIPLSFADQRDKADGSYVPLLITLLMLIIFFDAVSNEEGKNINKNHFPALFLSFIQKKKKEGNIIDKNHSTLSYQLLLQKITVENLFMADEMEILNKLENLKELRYFTFGFLNSF